MNPAEPTYGAYKIYEPPKDMWQLTFTKDKYIKVNLPSAPCWFHRLMQRIILGFVWEKLP